MNINNIIKDLYKYKNNEYNTKFINKVIKYFEKKNDVIINEINNNEYELTGIKIHLLYNNTYKYVLSNNLIQNSSYRKLNLNNKQLNNLLNQKYGLDNNDFKICKKIENNSNNENLFIIIINNKNKYDFINKDLAFVLLGIESLYFLNHQNLDNYCKDIILNNSNELLINLKNLKEILNKLSWIERNKIIIFSGLIYHFLGALYTKDIDLTIFCKNNEDKEKYIEYFKDLTNIDIEYFVEGDKSILYKWLFYKLPQLRNIDSIYTILINPKYHFYFMGIKCVDILTNFQGFTNRRANAVTINDTILLKKINNIDFYNIFCIKNFNIRNGETRIFTDTVINSMFNNVINIMKKWWNIDISIEYLKKHINKCDILFKQIDYTYIKYCNKYTKKILKLIKIFTESIISKYIKKKSIYEIEFNRMPYLKLYNNLKVKYIYGIDNSIYNINYISKKIQKYNIKYNLSNGSFNDSKLDSKFDVILLLFSIQTVINDPDKFRNNILNISKPGTIIIITYIDGTKIYDELKKNNKIEIKYNNNIYWSVYPFNDLNFNKVLFYMNDVIKYDYGMEEYLVFNDVLMNIFKDFNLINEISFLESNIFDNLKPFQKEILSYYKLLILKYK